MQILSKNLQFSIVEVPAPGKTQRPQVPVTSVVLIPVQNYFSLDTNFKITSKNTLKRHCTPAVLMDAAKGSLQNVLRPTIKSNIA